MTCPTAETLYLHLDGQLPPGTDRLVAEHLAECSACRQRLEEHRRTHDLVRSRLADAARAAAPDVSGALVEQRQRLAQREQRRLDMRRLLNTRTVGSAIALVALVTFLSIAPGRALARQFLSIFRVRDFAVVEVEPDREQLAALEDIMPEPVAITDEPVVSAPSLEEASALAGFDVRVPAYPEVALTEIEVKGATEYTVDVDPQTVRLGVAAAGMDPDLVPAEFAGGQVSMRMPAAVHVQTEAYELVQALDPVAEYPEGIDPHVIGEAGLRLMGVPADQAAELARQIDWTSTLVLPIPRDLASVSELVVNGHDAVLIEPRREDHSERTVLLWQVDGIVYVLSGQQRANELLRIAESIP
jgi:hypothetical protein